MTARALLATLLLLFAAAASADVYKWVDDKGKSHFSDHPPTTGREATHLEVLHGIPRSIQTRIREAAPVGVDIQRISGDGRDCDVSGEAESHATLMGFVERLRLGGIGEPRNNPADSKGPARGSEVFTLHLVLYPALLEQAREVR